MLYLHKKAYTFHFFILCLIKSHLASFSFGFLIFCDVVGSLKYWYNRSKVDYLVSKSATWNDDAVHGALDSAAFWVKDLPFVKSLSGYWKFFFATSPTSVPIKFYESEFQDAEWNNLPG